MAAAIRLGSGCTFQKRQWLQNQNSKKELFASEHCFADFQDAIAKKDKHLQDSLL
jgi:hypothetical protein